MLRSCRLASNDSGRHAAHRLLRSIAKHRTPEAAFDYADGSAEAELSLRRGRSIELVDRAVRVGFDTALGARSTLVGRA